MRIRLTTALILVLFFYTSSLAQNPKSDQDWYLNRTVSSDAITISCSELVLPSDVGRLLDEPNPINFDTGEMSQTTRSAHPIKVTLQPQTGTSDSLSTISGCSIDGSLLMLKTNDVGDVITLTSTGNIGSSLVLDSIDDVVLLVLRGATWYIVSGPAAGGTSGGENYLLDNATPGNPLIIRRGGDDFWKDYIDDSGNPIREGVCNNTTCDLGLLIQVGRKLTLYDSDLLTPIMDINPGAGSLNLMYEFKSGYQPLVSAEVPLRAIGNCALNDNEDVVTNASTDAWITCADAVGDAVTFNYTVTTKISTDTTAKIIMQAVNKNVSPTGTFTLNCAAQSVRPGTDAITAHSTTGQQPVSFTSWGAQNRLQEASATFTINGTVATGARIKGQCNVSAAPAQIADIRLLGTAMIELSANSWSD